MWMMSNRRGFLSTSKITTCTQNSLNVSWMLEPFDPSTDVHRRIDRLPLIVQGVVDGWKEVTAAVGVLVSHPTFETLGHINLKTFRLPCQQFIRQYSSTA
jgi:hypothetical protein